MRIFKNDFLEAASELSSFYPYLSGLPPLTSLATKKATTYSNRETLIKALMRQYENLPLHPAVQLSLENLKRPETFTITTGHQLCLGTGPLYVILKTLTIIRQAEEWSKNNSGITVVPVFWMASEDHDFAEANHVFVHPDTKIKYTSDWKGPVGRHILKPEISALLEEEALQWLKQFYQPGKSYSYAFRHMMNFLFQEFGLIILDGDDPELKQSFHSVFVDELESQKAAELLKSNSEKYGAHFPVQAFVRELNMFLLEKDARIPLKSLGNGLFSRPDGTEINLPGSVSAVSFSPSALLRPLYQEFVLPNLAYVGGWAELAYWMQCGELFKHYQVPFPALIPRFTATLIPENVAEGVSDIHESPDVLETTLLESIWPSGPWKDQSANLLENIQRLENMILQVDQSLIRTLEGEKHKMQSFLMEQFPKKIRKQIKNKYADKFKPIDTFRKWIQPNGELQERVLSISAFSQKPKDLIQFLYKYPTLYPGKPVLIKLPNQFK